VPFQTLHSGRNIRFNTNTTKHNALNAALGQLVPVTSNTHMLSQATSCQTSPARPHNTDTATPDRYHTAPV
jgi:hypothetical protein